MGWLLFLGIGALIAVGAYVAYQREQKRVGALRQFALSMSWEFSPKDPYGLAERWASAPFGRGQKRTARNVMSGRAGERSIVAFEYSYQESSDNGSSRTTRTYRYAVFALGLPCGLPQLHVGPEGFLSRIGNALGFDDIELESEEFNRRYRVQCADRKFATDVLTPRTMELLLSVGRIEFRFAGMDVLCFHEGRLDPADLLNRMATVGKVLDGIPSFVWRDRGIVPRSHA